MARGPQDDRFDGVPKASERRSAKRRNVIIGASSIIGLALVIGATFGWLSIRRKTQAEYCKANLKQIGYALQSYHDLYGMFPPAYVADKTGKPMHSWRVLTLQNLGPEEQAIFKAYRFDEPWNGPNNSRLADRMPEFYRCPGSKHGAPLTHCVAVRGPETVFPGAESRRFLDVIDGPHTTIMIVESMKAVHWMAPDDVSVDEFFNTIRAAGSNGSHHRNAFHVLHVDGSVYPVQMDANEALLNAMLTIDGKEAPGEF